jgi:hypothetical protein
LQLSISWLARASTARQTPKEEKRGREDRKTTTHLLRLDLDVLFQVRKRAAERAAATED